MPAPLSAFNGVQFNILVQAVAPGATIPLSAILLQQTPKLINRWAPVRVGTVAKSITGVPALQEIDRAWFPCALVFSTSERPPALMSDTIINSFIAGMNTGGTHTLTLEGVNKRVMFDWSNGFPLAYNEVTPTGEEDVILPDTVKIHQRLYEGSVKFLIVPS